MNRAFYPPACSLDLPRCAFSPHPEDVARIAGSKMAAFRRDAVDDAGREGFLGGEEAEIM